MDNETFWKRYLFRVHQVETEEEKRKALLQGNFYNCKYYFQYSLLDTGSVEMEEEFSWEDDEEDATMSPKNAQSMNDSISSEHTLGVASKSGRRKKVSAPPSQVDTSATTSPRLSSEDSYDLVSSGSLSNTGETKVRTKKGDDDDPDSDWE